MKKDSDSLTISAYIIYMPTKGRYINWDNTECRNDKTTGNENNVILQKPLVSMVILIHTKRNLAWGRKGS